MLRSDWRAIQRHARAKLSATAMQNPTWHAWPCARYPSVPWPIVPTTSALFVGTGRDFENRKEENRQLVRYQRRGTARAEDLVLNNPVDEAKS